LWCNASATEGTRGARVSSHGRSHRFDPCHAHHDLAGHSFESSELLGQLVYPRDTRIIIVGRLPPKGIEGIDQGFIGVGQQMAVDIKDGSYACMACSSGDFFGIGSGCNPQADSAMPEVMHANAVESGRLDSRQPEPKAEVGPGQ
jgi:hypothetical protein